jgi:hypothetical protein
LKPSARIRDMVSSTVPLSTKLITSFYARLRAMPEPNVGPDQRNRKQKLDPRTYGVVAKKSDDEVQ